MAQFFATMDNVTGQSVDVDGDFTFQQAAKHRSGPSRQPIS